MKCEVSFIAVLTLCSACTTDQLSPDDTSLAFQCKIVETCTLLDGAQTNCTPTSDGQAFEFLYGNEQPSFLNIAGTLTRFDYHGHMHTPQLIVTDNAADAAPRIPLPDGTQFYENDNVQSFRFLRGWLDGRPDTIESLLLRQDAQFAYSASCTCAGDSTC